LPLDRVHFFSVPLLKKGAVRRVDAVLQFWCLDPESANGDSGIYDPTRPSHNAVVTKLQEWAHDLVSIHWGLKENAFEALMKSAMKKTGKEETEEEKKARRSAAQMSKKNQFSMGFGMDRRARAPKNEEEQMMIVRSIEKTEIEVFEKLLDLAMERSLTTSKAKETMRDNVRKGRFTMGHYVNMWLKRLGGNDDPEVLTLAETYQNSQAMTTMVFEEEQNEEEGEDESVSEDNPDYELVIGKTLRTTDGLKMKITQEVWESIALIQSSWRKFWKRSKDKLTAKLSTEELREVVKGLQNVIPVDKVPALDAFTSRGEFGPDAQKARRHGSMMRGSIV
jgi:hypothetical protein